MRFKTAKLRYRYAQINRPLLDHKRSGYAKVLANLICRRSPLCYMDETTFNVQGGPRRSWSHRDSPLNHYFESNRHSTTVFCAIGDCLKKPVFMTGTATNNEEYKRFITLLASEVKADSYKPYLVYDGAP